MDLFQVAARTLIMKWLQGKERSLPNWIIAAGTPARKVVLAPF
jgi:hypothetical protein